MPRFPYFGFPHYYNYVPNYPHNLATPKNSQPSSNSYIKNTHSENRSSSPNANVSHTEDYKSIPIDDDVLFDLFGLKIYFDDILIIGLLFLLYNEEVKDEGLFIALILLLLT